MPVTTNENFDPVENELHEALLGVETAQLDAEVRKFRKDQNARYRELIAIPEFRALWRAIENACEANADDEEMGSPDDDTV